MKLREALAILYKIDIGNIYVGNGSGEVLSDILFLIKKMYSALNVLQVGYKIYQILVNKYSYQINFIKNDNDHNELKNHIKSDSLTLIDSINR
jgi:histidinol-phosphate aminotransferase